MQAGEIVGISITLLLLLLIVMVVVGVLVLKVRLISWKANERLVELMEFKTIQSVEALKSIQPLFLKSTRPLFYNLIIAQLRPNVLRTEKVFRNGARDSSGGERTENNGGRAIEMNYTTVQNGSAGVVIDGTTYTHASNGIGATG